MRNPSGELPAVPRKWCVGGEARRIQVEIQLGIRGHLAGRSRQRWEIGKHHQQRNLESVAPMLRTGDEAGRRGAHKQGCKRNQRRQSNT